MSSGATAVVIVLIVLVVVLVGAVAVEMHSRSLQRRFGPEYNRAISEQNSTLRAEAELVNRQRRVRKLNIRPLSDDSRRRYRTEAIDIQQEFVDSPQTSVAAAHALITQVMQERGYPADDDEQAMSDLSVEHAQTIGHFRAAQQITGGATGDASTEDLRRAFIHYRVLFAELLDEPELADHLVGTPSPDRRRTTNDDGAD